jgi:hypothetical protein
MFSQWSCCCDEETCSSIACVGNVLADTGFETKTFRSLWRFEVRTFEPKERMLMNGRTLLRSSCVCCFWLTVEVITQLQPSRYAGLKAFYCTQMIVKMRCSWLINIFVMMLSNLGGGEFG